MEGGMGFAFILILQGLAIFASIASVVMGCASRVTQTCATGGFVAGVIACAPFAVLLGFAFLSGHAGNWLQFWSDPIGRFIAAPPALGVFGSILSLLRYGGQTRDSNSRRE
jgi:hypothetical protein